jgi:hypothetical protein
MPKDSFLMSRIMTKIENKDIKSEVMSRTALHRIGFRQPLHRMETSTGRGSLIASKLFPHQRRIFVREDTKQHGRRFRSE